MNDKSYNAAGNGPNESSGRFGPPQPNNTGSSSQDMDNSNTTTVYYEKLTGECQNKTASVQTSPRYPGHTGTTTTAQAANKKTSQVGGTQTTPPPSPKESTLMGGTQTSPPTCNLHQQVGQGQLDCNQDKEAKLPILHQAKARKTRS